MKNFKLAMLLLTLAACTSQQQLPKSTDSPIDAAGAPIPDPQQADANGTQSPDLSPPVCLVGSIGCPCRVGQCDDGLNCLDGNCAAPNCGDGQLDPGESCDKGPENNDTTYGGCKKNCSFGPRCGDSVKNGIESCDDGNTDDGDLCSNMCAKCSDRSGSLACGGRCQTGVSGCTGEQCAAASCAVNSFTAARICDSSGKCPAAVSAECGAGLACESSACRTACTTDAHCAAGRTCSNGACVVKGCGNNIIEPPETCEDGNTVDDDACSNGCVKCSSRSGYRECSVNGASKCLANAVCCPGAVCSPVLCSVTGLVVAQTCNAKGECPVGTSAACPNNFVCEGAACRTSCTSNGQCLNSRVCYKGDCIVPLCGNGEIEPGETCDNGNSNADNAPCGADCKTCTVRGRKECNGVCLAVGQCCSDADCPANSTAGKCDQVTRKCWKERRTIDLAVLSTGYCLGHVGCVEPKLEIEGALTGFVKFRNDVPETAFVESATVAVAQSNSATFEPSSLRIASCGTPYIQDCTDSTDSTSKVLCAQWSLKTCAADLTSEVRSGNRVFVLEFFPRLTFPSTAKYYYSSPSLKVTFLVP